MLFKRMNKKNLISTLVSVALLIVFAIIIKSVHGFKNLANIYGYFLIFSIAALALNIICGCLGEFVLGHAGFLLVGYTASVLITKLVIKLVGIDFIEQYIYIVNGDKLHFLGYIFIIVLALLSGVVTGLIGLLVGSIALGRLKGDYLAIVTLGISLIFVNVCKNIKPLGGAGGIGISTEVGGNVIIYTIFLIFAVFLIMMFMKSRFGRGILACRDDNIAAEASGIPVNKYKVLAFTFATFICGIAGSLLANKTTLQPIHLGQERSIYFLVVIVLGGLGSLTGTILSTGVLVFYEYWFCKQNWVPEFFAENPKIVYGVILVLIMLFRSSGILGNSEFSWKWFYIKVKELWGKIKNVFKRKEAPKEVE